MSAILIVDDSLTVRGALAEALDSAGFATISCATIADARTALQNHRVALAILDLELPDGDGVELLVEIRRQFSLSELPVLMLSAGADIRDRIRALRGGANDFVGKPSDSSYVIERVKRLIGTPPVADLVLIIDGSKEACDQLSAALRKAGLTTAYAATGNDGLRLAATARPAALVVDAALADMDGASVVRRLRLDPALRTTPCLLVTEYGAKDVELRGLEAGADSVARKDHLDALVARVRALLRSAGPAHADTTSLLAPRRVLLVDDDPDYRGMLGDRLRTRGFDVVHAASGEEAIELLSVQSVDCILLDRTMAGIGGLETCRRLKASIVTRDTPLIFLTASEERAVLIEGLDAGADDFVSKGRGFEVVAARIQAQIRRKQIEDERRALRRHLLRSELDAADLRAAKALADACVTKAAALEHANDELSRANRELEAFSYSVSHDLRAPLRAISTFSRTILDDLGDRAGERAREQVRRVLGATSRMSDLIDALLELARIAHAPIGRHPVDLSLLAHSVVEELSHREPRREVGLDVAPGLVASADGRLMRIVLDHLIGNAWKFTSRRAGARIWVGSEPCDGELAYFVRDNGAGFDMAHAGRLFTPFHRSHTDGELCGAGIGLATVRRIVERHGGKIWAEGSLGDGAKISFTVPLPALVESSRQGQ